MFSQTQNPDFLDGVIIFKLKDFIEPNTSKTTKSSDNIGLIIDIEDYPEIEYIFKDINIISFERPSFYSGKRELKKFTELFSANLKN